MTRVYKGNFSAFEGDFLGKEREDGRKGQQKRITDMIGDP